MSVYSIVHECVHRPPFSLFCSFSLLLLFPGVFFAERKAKEEEEEEDDWAFRKFEVWEERSRTLFLVGLAVFQLWRHMSGRDSS